MHEDLEDEMIVFHGLHMNKWLRSISNGFNAIDIDCSCSSTTVVIEVWNITVVAKMSHFLGGSRC